MLMPLLFTLALANVEVTPSSGPTALGPLAPVELPSAPDLLWMSGIAVGGAGLVWAGYLLLATEVGMRLFLALLGGSLETSTYDRRQLYPHLIGSGIAVGVGGAMVVTGLSLRSTESDDLGPPPGEVRETGPRIQWAFRF